MTRRIHGDNHRRHTALGGNQPAARVTNLSGDYKDDVHERVHQHAAVLAAVLAGLMTRFLFLAASRRSAVGDVAEPLQSTWIIDLRAVVLVTTERAPDAEASPADRDRPSRFFHHRGTIRRTSGRVRFGDRCAAPAVSGSEQRRPHALSQSTSRYTIRRAEMVDAGGCYFHRSRVREHEPGRRGEGGRYRPQYSRLHQEQRGAARGG